MTVHLGHDHGTHINGLLEGLGLGLGRLTDAPVHHEDDVVGFLKN